MFPYFSPGSMKPSSFEEVGVICCLVMLMVLAFTGVVLYCHATPPCL